MKKVVKIVLIVLIGCFLTRVALILGVIVVHELSSMGWEQYITTDVADYGEYIGNIDNKRAENFITAFFPEQIEDYFSEVQYSYRAEEGDTCAFEAYLEFVIEEPEQYKTFVEEHTSELNGKEFSYAPEFIEYVHCDTFCISSIIEETQEEKQDVSIRRAEIGKILCCDEEQRIIFVALGVYDGGGANTEFLKVYFERFDIKPQEYEREYYNENTQISL